MRLYSATTNRGKLREFRLAVERFGGGAIELLPLAGMEGIPPCEETGDTFEQNAVQKALYYSQHAPGLLFVDDSGLEAAALGGEPGVRSARFAGEGAGDRANNRLLLDRLAGVEDRTAQFVCVVAVAMNGRLLGTFRGAVEGRIADAERGSNGFGYDPLFLYPPFGCTFGEVTEERKLEVSHRAKALEQMVRWLLRTGDAKV